MNYRSITLSLVALCLVALALPAQAQTDRSGSAAMPELLIPVTARQTSLSTALTSGLNNMNALEALLSNPAGLSVGTGTSVMFSRMDYLADIGVNHVGIGQQIGANHIAFSITSWDMGDIARQTEESPDITSVTFSAGFIAAGVTYARTLTDRISAGLTAKVLNERIDDMNATAVAFDAGMDYVVGETGLRFGVSVNNIGTEAQYSGTGLVREVRLPGQQDNATRNAVAIEAASHELPTLLNFGVAYTRQLNASADVTILGNYRSNSFEQDQYAAGLEVGLMNVLYVRGGYEYVPDQDLSAFEGYSVGAGLNVNFGGSSLMFDYAYKPTDRLGNVNYLTLSASI